MSKFDPGGGGGGGGQHFSKTSKIQKSEIATGEGSGRPNWEFFHIFILMAPKRSTDPKVISAY